MFSSTIDFYSSTNLKSYNLDRVMKYQLDILERLDPFTRTHSENVANLVCRICEYLKCSKKFIIHATISGYLHDVGKIFIPPEILSKPERLTDEEYEIIKTHTTLGYDMCYKDLKLRPYAEGALNHHEALNGTGYPNGKTKKDIPYVAQIIRVADEYDAIVTKRQYKTHINISETLKELIKDARPEDHLKSVALDMLAGNSKDGKINPKILKVLFKVVIDDTLYEISGVSEYVDYLKEEIKRLELVASYHEKMEKATKEKQKNYYQEGIRMLLKREETMENYRQILAEYKQAYQLRTDVIQKLYQEIKIIKKLKV